MITKLEIQNFRGLKHVTFERLKRVNLLPIWKGLLAICEQENVQMFATTHSLECARAASVAARERNQDELGVQRLQAVDGKLEVVALSGETLAYALENNLEFRKACSRKRSGGVKAG